MYTQAPWNISLPPASQMLSLNRLLEELILIQSSLLPGEHLDFIGSPSLHLDSDNVRDEDEDEAAAGWKRLVDGGMVGGGGALDHMEALSPAARFRITVDGAAVSFEIDCQGYDGECRSVNDCISINGDNLSRAVQESWRGKIKEKLIEVADTGGEFPIYQLLSLYLLPLLHEDAEKKDDTGTGTVVVPQGPPSLREQVHHHVLFTSHHLVSPTKRRNLQAWASSLKVSGFAKVGYPGVIYAQGSKESIEELVENVKAMQWLALKVRFVEPLEGISDDGGGGGGGGWEQLRGWREFEKVGEVVEEMRRLGRGKYVLEMGIGAGTVGELK